MHVFHICESLSVLEIRSFFFFFKISHISNTSFPVHLSVTISTSIHVAANDVISFFLMAELYKGNVLKVGRS